MLDDASMKRSTSNRGMDIESDFHFKRPLPKLVPRGQRRGSEESRKSNLGIQHSWTKQKFVLSPQLELRLEKDCRENDVLEGVKPVFFFNKVPLTRQIKNLCKFKCTHKTCDASSERITRIFGNLKELNHHMQRQHCEDRHELDDCITKLVLFLCPLCKDDVILPCDKFLIFDHAAKVHGKSQNEFREGLTRLMRERPESFELATRDVANRCIYACTSCTSTFSSPAAAHRHSRLKHKHKTTDNNKNYLTNDDNIHFKTTRLVKHQCKICRHLIPCDVASIAKHAAINHGICLNKYRIFDAPVTTGDKEGTSEVNNSVGNYCTFLCPLCPNRHSASSVFANTLQFSQHMGDAHGWEGGYIANADKHLMFKVDHECQICLQHVLCDEASIALHCWTAHGVTFDQYGGILSRGKDLAADTPPEENRRNSSNLVMNDPRRHVMSRQKDVERVTLSDVNRQRSSGSSQTLSRKNGFEEVTSPHLDGMQRMVNATYSASEAYRTVWGLNG